MLPLAFYPSQAYFNLVDSVDYCVFINDGMYASRRVSRTRLMDGLWLTLPTIHPGGNHVPLYEIGIWWDDGEWHQNMMTRLTDLYEYQFIDSNDVFKQIKKLPEYGNNLCHTLYKTTQGVMNYMHIYTKTALASDLASAAVDGQKRAIQVCKALKADEFVQPEWAKRFFDPVAFRRQGIRLSFFEVEREEEMQNSILDSCFDWFSN